MDADEIVNPKKTLQRRLIAAGESAEEAPTAPAGGAPNTGPRFGKQFSPEEKKAQAAKLADMLRKRE